ncbi:MAG TPA: hypothetical protein VH497_09425 [Vicinamibacterales bacterium]
MDKLTEQSGIELVRLLNEAAEKADVEENEDDGGGIACPFAPQAPRRCHVASTGKETTDA